MIVTLYAVFDAFVVFRLRETWVGSMYVALLTITKPLAPPLTVARSLFGNPVPGSKKPEPETEIPVIVTEVEDWPSGGFELATAGTAGGGAMSFVTRMP